MKTELQAAAATRLTGKEMSPQQREPRDNKMLSYRRETALHGALVLAKSERLFCYVQFSAFQ